MLEQKISLVLTQWCEIINERIKSKWENATGIVGEAHANTPIITAIGNIINANLEFYGQRAWICEYGSGSTSDTSNPYLDDYVSSSNFNDEYRSKSDMTIRGRNEGPYLDLDGNKHESTGYNAGKDLELKPVYTHMLPMHIIEYEVHDAMPEIKLAIEVAVGLELTEQLTMTVRLNL